jgi:zinc protease
MMFRSLTFRALIVLGAVLLVSSAGPASVVRPTRFDYTMTTLPNGLQVVYLEDHSTPITHLAIWYHVGSKDEQPGRTGFAHLFEHRSRVEERSDQHHHSSRRQRNAFTDEDATVCWEAVPSQCTGGGSHGVVDVSDEKLRPSARS